MAMLGGDDPGGDDPGHPWKSRWHDGHGDDWPEGEEEEEDDCLDVRSLSLLG